MHKTNLHPAPAGLDPLAWRPVTRDYLPALVDLAEAGRAADGGIAFLNEPEYLARRYFGDGSGTATGAFDAEGRLIACAAIHPADPAQLQIAGQVHPDFRGRGLGTDLMDWSQAQAARLLVAAGQSTGNLQIATESLTDAADRLYRAYGYEPADVQLIMRRDLDRPLPPRPIPVGISLATWGPDRLDPFYQAYHASFRDRPGFPGWSAAEWIEWTADDNLRPDWSLLALAGDQPAGFVTAGIEHGGTFIMQVGVIPEQRRRGLASALLVETMRRMQAAGQTTTELTVNAFNNLGAIAAYERIDFVTTGRRAKYERAIMKTGCDALS